MECNRFRYYSKTVGIIFLLCLLFTIPIYAQNDDDTPIRIEFASDKDWYGHSYLPIGAHGVMLINRGKMTREDTVVWNFTLYDTNFVKKQTISKLLLSSAALVTTYFSGSSYFLLLKVTNARKLPNRWFVVEGKLSNNSVKEEDIQINEIFPDMQSIYQFSVIEHHLVLFSSGKNENGYCFYDMDLGTVTNKIDLGEQSTEFVVTDTTAQKVMICHSSSHKNQDGISFGFVLNEFQSDGKLVAENEFPQYKGYSYKSARLVKTDSNSYLIVGTYSNETEKRNNNIHTGVYTITFNNGKFGYPNFYNYTSLKTKDAQAIVKAQGNNLNLQLVIGAVYSNNQQYGFVTEVFYPEYTTTNYYSPGSYYVSTPVSIFDGYRFLNAYITTFDQNGALLWDNYMPITNMLTQSLNPKVGLHIDSQNNGYIFYPNGSTVTSTLVHDYTVLEPILTEKLATSNPRDIVESTSQIKVERWFADSYLIYGYQTIKNPSRGKGGKRFVFFMNRLQYQ